MIEQSNKKSAFAILLYILAPTLCLFAPFVIFLSVNDYLLPRLEVLIIFSACLLVGLLSGTLKASGSSKSALIPLGAAVIFTVAFLTNIDTTTLAIGIAIGLSVIIWFLREHAAAILLVAASLHIASSLVLPPPDVGRISPANEKLTGDLATAGTDDDLPPILHLILDEFIGIHGLPKDVGGATELSDTLVDYYRNQQFLVYTHAYAEYSNTINSLTNLVNFESSSEDYVLQGSSFTFEENAYFEHLSNLGYWFNVFQTDYLDFCQAQGVRYASCHTYKSDTARPLDATELGPVDKAKFLFNSFLTTSDFTVNVRDKYERVRKAFELAALPAWPKYNRQTGPLSIIPSLQELNIALSEMKPANVYFAHFMTPHYPYAWRADCSIRPDAIWWLHRTPWEAGENTSNERTKRYQQYIEQIKCQQIKIDEMFDSIKQAGMWDSAIIIIHGDHGSRIVEHRANVVNREILTPRDYRDTYSVFFAYKDMSSIGEVNTTPQSLQKLLANVFLIPTTLTEDNVVYLGRGPEPDQKPEAHKLIGFDN